MNVACAVLPYRSLNDEEIKEASLILNYMWIP